MGERKKLIRRTGPSAAPACNRCPPVAALLGLCLGPVLLFAAEPSASSVSVVVRTADKDGITGQLLGLSLPAGATLRADAGAELKVATTDLVRITVLGPQPSARKCETVLTLVGDDFLCGRVLGTGPDAVTLDTLDLGAVTVPLDAVTGLLTTRASQPGHQRQLEALRGDTATDDRLLLTNGDTVRGFLSAISAEGVTLETDAGESQIPFRLIVAGRFAPPPAGAPARPYAVATLRSGGRVTVTELDWSGAVVRVRTRHDVHAQLDAERIHRVDVVGGRWESLSEREPISFTHTPMLSVSWPYMNDRNVLGGPLSVAGETYDNGIGVHSRSTLIYELKGEYRDFVTSFGLDDDSGAYGDVSVFVLVDGIKRFEQLGVVRGKLHGPVRVDVTRANRLDLICDFGRNGDLQDRLDWIEPALIRP